MTVRMLEEVNICGMLEGSLVTCRVVGHVVTIDLCDVCIKGNMFNIKTVT